MTPPKSHRVRAHKPKVKTGCKTCKIRRVKCDETKPQCHRCMKFGRECDGYGEPSDATSIVPKPRTIVSRVSSFASIAPLAAILPQPTTSIFTGPEEHQYFRYFEEHTAPALSGGFDSTIWNRIVLQTSTAEPAIHQLLVSVGALSVVTALEPQDPTLAIHRRYAFHEYDKALHGIRALATSGDSRSILIASMLIYCFESLHGNTSGAIQYLRSARNLTLGTTEPLVYRHFTPLPSAPKDIEKDLITAFARLDSFITNRMESEDPTRSSILGVQLDYYNEPYILPSRFIDTETARRYLEHIQHRSRPSVSQAEIIQPDSNSPTQDPERKLSSSELDLLNAQMRGWERAFEPLFRFARTRTGAKDYIAAMTMKIQGLSTACLIEGLVGIVPEGASPAPSSDKILQLCRDLVKYGWELVKDERFSKGFMFDFGIIPSLMIVVISSPDKALAREVVKILRAAAPRKEATWDAAKTADICEGILMMQEMQSNPSQGQMKGVQLVEIS